MGILVFKVLANSGVYSERTGKWHLEVRELEI
jgi:hypothetical protein